MYLLIFRSTTIRPFAYHHLVFRVLLVVRVSQFENRWFILQILTTEALRIQTCYQNLNCYCKSSQIYLKSSI